MNDKLIIEAFVKAIKENRITLDKVPENYKAQVKALIKEA
jgi:hypothetical protein